MSCRDRTEEFKLLADRLHDLLGPLCARYEDEHPDVVACVDIAEQLIEEGWRHEC